MSEKKGKMLTIALMIFGVIIFVFGIILISTSVLFGLMIMFGFLMFLISFLAYSIRYNKYGCLGSQGEVFDEESFNEAVSESLERNNTIVSTIYKYKEVKPTDEAVCMISKISLKGKADILKCVFCNSVFLGIYLRE